MSNVQSPMSYDCLRSEATGGNQYGCCIGWLGYFGPLTAKESVPDSLPLFVLFDFQHRPAENRARNAPDFVCEARRRIGLHQWLAHIDRTNSRLIVTGNEANNRLAKE